MPRARVEEWSALPTPQTPLQRGAFLDACIRWLVEEPPEAPPDDAEGGDGGAEAPPTALLPGAGAGAPCGARGVACTLADLGDRTTWRCVACRRGGDDVHPMAANPYAQQHIVLVCRACATEERGDEEGAP